VSIIQPVNLSHKQISVARSFGPPGIRNIHCGIKPPGLILLPIFPGHTVANSLTISILYFPPFCFACQALKSAGNYFSIQGWRGCTHGLAYQHDASKVIG
jgi:hypothetical protein